VKKSDGDISGGKHIKIETISLYVGIGGYCEHIKTILFRLLYQITSLEYIVTYSVPVNCTVSTVHNKPIFRRFFLIS